MSLEKVDLRRVLPELYRAGPTPAFVDVPPLSYLCVDGAGDPSGEAYQSAVAALYAVAYTVKFSVKRSEHPLDFVVMPLEGLWWAEDHADFVDGVRSAWLWTMMILQPVEVTDDIVAAAVAHAASKKPVVAEHRLRLETIEEGRCVQVMHTGPYAEEGPVIAVLHAAIAADGSRPRGKHHEIYLGDPRRSAPEKLRTILRQGVEPLRADRPA